MYDEPSAFRRHDYWVNTCYDWLVSIGLNPENLRLKVYPKDELAHYALATTDIEYKFPNGWGELWGIANRGSWDLECHSRGSGVDLRYADPTSNEVNALYPGCSLYLASLLCNRNTSLM